MSQAESLVRWTESDTAQKWSGGGEERGGEKYIKLKTEKKISVRMHAGVKCVY